MSVANLQRLLGQNGFEVERVERGEAHLGNDFFMAVCWSLMALAPVPNVPWRPPSTAGAFVWRNLVVLVGSPLLLAGAVLDRALAPLLRRPGLSNTYRVVARKR